MKMREKMQPGEVKPGWTTTEFWQTLLVQAIAPFVTLGTVFHTHFRLNGLQAVVPAVATFAAAVAQSVYSHSRATVKAAAQTAGVMSQTAYSITSPPPHPPPPEFQLPTSASASSMAHT